MSNDGPASDGGGGGSWFAPDQRAALLDFWSVYQKHFDERNQVILEVAAEHPDFHEIMRQMTPEARALESSQARSALQRAIDGNWPEYERRLRGQGARLATHGVSFQSWYDVMRASHGKIIPHLVTAFANEPARLSATLTAMLEFIERAMAAIAAGYLDAKERGIAEQRELAEQRTRELVASEESLRHRTAILHSVLDSMSDGVLVVDVAGHYLVINAAVKAILGLPADAALLRGWERRMTVLYPDGVTPFPIDQSPQRRALRGERSGEVDLFIRSPHRPDGLMVTISASPLVDASGAVWGAVSTCRDISERVRLAEAKRRTAELEAQNRRIQEANRMKSEFLANMSHELRTPLNAIVGFADLLHSGQVPVDAPEYHEFLDDILTSARHLLQLINDVLDLSKVEAGKMVFCPELVELPLLIREVVGILRAPAAEKHITVEISVEPELAEVVLDPARLKQVLYNYLSNALKFTPEHGRIWVRGRADGAEHFQLQVEDTGIGIGAADLPRLFSQFEQLDAGRGKRHAGTGLGLALTRRLVEAQGGSVSVSSTPGQGSTFVARLPRAHRESVAAVGGESVSLPSGALRVLVVEDEPQDRQQLIAILSEAGYAVDSASNGASALERIASTAYHAITLDLLLPDMSGLDVLRVLRSQGANVDVPVVVVTVVTELGVVTGFPHVEVLTKPIERAVVLQTLTQLREARPVGVGAAPRDDQHARQS